MLPENLNAISGLTLFVIIINDNCLIINWITNKNRNASTQPKACPEKIEGVAATPETEGLHKTIRE